MGDITEAATAILSTARQRLELAGQNIASSTTPGYRRRVSFTELLVTADGRSAAPIVKSMVSATPGKQTQTDNPYDLAIVGGGYFAVRLGEQIAYSRNGQFARDAGGRLVLADGAVLQGDRGDLVLEGSDFVLALDGVVSSNGQPIGRIPVFDFDANLAAASGEAFRPAAETAPSIADAQIRQGALEASNVTTGEEMVVLMESLRRAETAQRLINVYDDLMGRAITGFGQA